MSDLTTHLAREGRVQRERELREHLAARAVADQRRALRLARLSSRLPA
jgi:hypothetical protein